MYHRVVVINSCDLGASILLSKKMERNHLNPMLDCPLPHLCMHLQHWSHRGRGDSIKVYERDKKRGKIPTASKPRVYEITHSQISCLAQVRKYFDIFCVLKVVQIVIASSIFMPLSTELMMYSKRRQSQLGNATLEINSRFSFKL